MGLPAYPPDWATTWKNVQRGLKGAYTGAQSRVRYAAIRAASLVLGDQQGSRIVIDPHGAAGAPSITFRPQTGSKVATLGATSTAYADEVTVALIGGVNNKSTVYAQITMGGGIIRVAMHDAGSGALIRSIDVTEDYTMVGGPVGDKPWIWVDDDGIQLRADVQGGGGTWLILGTDGTVSKGPGW